jgi:hypothetical protein
MRIGIMLTRKSTPVQRSAWNHLIAAIHASGRQAVIAVTGGGSLAIGELLKVPGGSQSLLEAMVPYSQPALVDFLGGTPDQFCSEPTARAMAMAAWMRARKLAIDADPLLLVGIGATASLVSDVPKRGEHRVQVGVQTANRTASYSLALTKGLRDRTEEEQLSAEMLLLALGEACGVEVSDAQAAFDQSLHEGETITRNAQAAESAWTRLLLGEEYCVASSNNRPSAVFPGAFHPLHEGHRKMARFAAERLRGEVAYELSITNVDKPPLDFVEINNRLGGIREQEPDRQVFLTAAPTFREKALLLSNTTFVVGIDTLVRIADVRYYQNDERQRDVALREIAEAGCRFLVFGRELNGKFCSLSDVEIPAGLKAMCTEVPASEFREDVSSTELRKS